MFRLPAGKVSGHHRILVIWGTGPADLAGRDELPVSLPGGDHEIVVGRVQGVEISDDGAAPLLYWRGSYLPLGGS